MKVIRAYKCQFCRRGRAYISASSCLAHEDRCHDNPASRSCATCNYLHRYLIENERKPGGWSRAYTCLAEEPGRALTTRCHSWELRPDEPEGLEYEAGQRWSKSDDEVPF